MATFLRIIREQTTNCIETNQPLELTRSFSPSYFHPPIFTHQFSPTSFHPPVFTHLFPPTFFHPESGWGETVTPWAKFDLHLHPYGGCKCKCHPPCGWKLRGVFWWWRPGIASNVKHFPIVTASVCGLIRLGLVATHRKTHSYTHACTRTHTHHAHTCWQTHKFTHWGTQGVCHLAASPQKTHRDRSVHWQ